MHDRTPTRDEKWMYAENGSRTFYFLGFLSSFFLLSGMLLFVMRSGGAFFYAPFVAVIGVYLFFSYAVGLPAKKWEIESHYDAIRNGLGRTDEFEIDVFYCICREGLVTVHSALEAIRRLKWAGKINVHVLNDGFAHRDWLYNYCNIFGMHLIERPDQGFLKKAGNLRYAFGKTSAPFIAIFDADFCPRREYFYDVMPYFVEEKVGIVQTPQFFSVNAARGWVQKGAAQIQELFYRLIQPARDYWGAPVCVGTNAVYRRKALEPMGGTYPIEYSEDIHTGFAIGSYGYRTRYIPINMAGGECPSDLKSFFSQQYRWCMGSISLLVSKVFWRQRSLTLMQRLCFLSGMFYYIATALGVVFTPLPGLYMVYFAPQYLFWFNYLFVVPSFLFGTVFMYFWSKQPFGLYSLRARNASYWAHLFAIVDKLRGNLMPWIPTGERQTGNRRVEIFYYISQFWVAFTLVAGIYGASTRMGNWRNVNFYPFLFFLALNSIVGFIDYKDVFGGKKR